MWQLCCWDFCELFYPIEGYLRTVIRGDSHQLNEYLWKSRGVNLLKEIFMENFRRNVLICYLCKYKIQMTLRPLHTYVVLTGIKPWIKWWHSGFSAWFLSKFWPTFAFVFLWMPSFWHESGKGWYPDEVYWTDSLCVNGD